MIKEKNCFEAEFSGGLLAVRILGEIDHHSALGIRHGIDAMIFEKRPTRLILDLSRIDFMDSSGLGLIMGRFALVKKYGGTFSVLDPSPAVLKIITLAGMERMVTILRTKKKTEVKKEI